MYPLFESIKVVDGKLHHIDWHHKRYARSYKSLYNKDPLSHLTDHISIPTYANVGIYKLRISYNDQYKKIEFDPYTIKEINSLKLVEKDKITYDSKFNDRSTLLEAYKQKDDCDDVLIIKNGLVTDSSYSNIVFYTGTKWVTPSSPLLLGTARARLINEGHIQEKEIKQSDISSFQSFKLINAMRSFDIIPSIDISQIKD
ncbi:UNVERIFIED_CONTAM: hypothetical protein GTU68_066910 [Idotea baltica]|nr:hypothetical protein [Idotea baltica]